MTQPLPLAGIRILDLSRVLAGPFATMLLADLGADVWKLEPPAGDETRTWGPPFWGDPREQRSAYFASVNRNKRSLVVNLQTDAGRALLDRLAARADLLVHNLRPSTADRLGVTQVADRHPQMVVSAIGGFVGTDVERPAYDLLAQAVSGLMSVTGEPHAGPMKVGVALLDLIAGLEAALGALAGLLARERGSERAHRFDVSLVETGVASLVNVLGNHLASGHEAQRHGNAHPNIVPYETFAVADGHVAIAVGNDAQFASLCEVLGLPSEARFATNPARLAAREALTALLAERLATWRREPLVAALRDADVPAGPVNGVADAVADMERATGGWVRELDGMRLAPSPLHVDDGTAPLRRPPPLLGEHTDELLLELGVPAVEIATLRASRTIA
jgi:crotonobetainyl-CoA:carnitine CoA-transferase CaiB-like acyl-CoA transferase